MSTMYQPTMPNYQGTMGGFQPGGYQPSFGLGQQTLGFGQPSPEDVQRIIPVLAPVLATVIPAVVPPIVNAIFSQQRSLGFGGGNYQQTSPEDVQRILPVLGPVLASVIPAVLPHIINSVLTQQRQMAGWGGGQSLGGGQYGYQPQFGWGSQPQFGFGSQVPGQDLTQTVASSVNDALRRAGIQQPSFGGRF